MTRSETGAPALTEPTEPRRTNMPTPPTTAVPGAWEGAGDVRAPVVARSPSAKVVDAVANGVEFLRGDDRGGGVA